MRPERLVRAWEPIIEWRGKPRMIRCDMGRSTSVQCWQSGLRSAGYSLRTSSPASRSRTRPSSYRRTVREDWVGHAVRRNRRGSGPRPPLALDLRSRAAQQGPGRHHPIAETVPDHRSRLPMARTRSAHGSGPDANLECRAAQVRAGHPRMRPEVRADRLTVLIFINDDRLR